MCLIRDKNESLKPEIADEYVSYVGTSWFHRDPIPESCILVCLSSSASSSSSFSFFYSFIFLPQTKPNIINVASLFNCLVKTSSLGSNPRLIVHSFTLIPASESHQPHLFQAISTSTTNNFSLSHSHEFTHCCAQSLTKQTQPYSCVQYIL